MWQMAESGWKAEILLHYEPNGLGREVERSEATGWFVGSGH